MSGKVWYCPNCGQEFKTADFKYCPYCSNALERIIDDYEPKDSSEIFVDKKIKAFDRLHAMAKEIFLSKKSDYENGAFVHCDEDAREYIFEAVMELLVDNEKDIKRFWDTYNKYLR